MRWSSERTEVMGEESVVLKGAEPRLGAGGGRSGWSSSSVVWSELKMAAWRLCEGGLGGFRGG